MGSTPAQNKKEAREQKEAEKDQRVANRAKAAKDNKVRRAVKKSTRAKRVSADAKKDLTAEQVDKKEQTISAGGERVKGYVTDPFKLALHAQAYGGPADATAPRKVSEENKLRKEAKEESVRKWRGEAKKDAGEEAKNPNHAFEDERRDSQTPHPDSSFESHPAVESTKPVPDMGDGTDGKVVNDPPHSTHPDGKKQARKRLPFSPITRAATKG